MRSASHIARLASVAAGLALVAAPAFAQPPGRRDGPRGLEAEVGRLKSQVNDLQAEVDRLKALVTELQAERKAAGVARTKDGGRPGEDRRDGARPPGRGFGPGEFGRPGMGPKKEVRERLEVMPREREFGPPGRGFGPGGFGPPGPGPMRERFEGGRGFGPTGRPGASAVPADRSAEVLERLDRLAREIDELRRLVRK